MIQSQTCSAPLESLKKRRLLSRTQLGQMGSRKGVSTSHSCWEQLACGFGLTGSPPCPPPSQLLGAVFSVVASNCTLPCLSYQYRHLFYIRVLNKIGLTNKEGIRSCIYLSEMGSLALPCCLVLMNSDFCKHWENISLYHSYLRYSC